MLLSSMRSMRASDSKGIHASCAGAGSPLATACDTPSTRERSETSGEPAPAHDAWIPLLSLARMLRIDESNMPAAVPYVAADPTLRREAHAAISSLPGRLRAGLAWTGNRANTNDARRSIELAALRPLLDLTDVTWVSLQKDDGADPRNDPQDLDRLVRLPWRNDFEGLAALIESLDLVVSVDTSVAHVAGALAKPVHILLPHMSDWRWRKGRTDSDWYPTATLFRQSRPGDWAGVISSVRKAVSAFA